MTEIANVRMLGKKGSIARTSRLPLVRKVEQMTLSDAVKWTENRLILSPSEGQVYCKKLLQLGIVQLDNKRATNSIVTLDDQRDVDCDRDLSVQQLAEINRQSQGYPIPEIQKLLIQRYQGNEYLDGAMKGINSLEESLAQLDKPFKGIKRWLPHLKDETHNLKVKKFGEIIPADHLEKKGIFYLDNFVTGTIEGVVLFAGLSLGYAVRDLATDPKALEEIQSPGTVYSLMGMVGVLGLLIGFRAQYDRYQGKKNAEAAVHYLDGKIKELF